MALLDLLRRVDVLQKIKEIVDDVLSDDEAVEKAEKKTKAKKKTKKSGSKTSKAKKQPVVQKKRPKDLPPTGSERESDESDEFKFDDAPYGSDSTVDDWPTYDEDVREKRREDSVSGDTGSNDASVYGDGITKDLPKPPSSFSNRFAKDGGSSRSLMPKEKVGMSKFLDNKPEPAAASKRFADKGGLKGSGAPKSEDVAKDPSLVYLVRGKDRGKDAWHYVLVKRNLLPIFLKHTQGGTVDVAKFGSILFSGWGKDPPAEIVAKIDNGEY